MKSKLMKNGVMLTAAVVAAFAAVIGYAFRISYVFIDSAVFSGLSMLLLGLAVLSALVLLALYVIKAKGIKKGDKLLSDSKAFEAVYFTAFAAGCFFIVYDIVNVIISGAETSPVAMRMLGEAFPYVAAVFTIVFFALIMPTLKNEKVKRAVSALALMGVALSAVLTLFPCYTYKITSDPMVIDGGNYYSVVFATNDKGTGYIEYEYDGKEYKTYDEDGGRIKGDSKIHTIRVSKQHLENNSYRVGSKRVVDELSYGGRSGKEIVTDYYEFKAPRGNEQRFLTVSDWHTKTDKAIKAAEKTEGYNGVILLGDAVPGLMFEEEVIDNIIEFGGALTGGSMPVIYVRGNHETRGPVADDLSEYLGLYNYYYTVNYGRFSFLVLDSGEDKADDHPEYGGMVNYSAYREDMVNWLSVQPKTVRKTLALSHSSDICIEEDLNAKAYGELQRLGIKQIVSGHTHTYEALEENGMRIYRDGGDTSDGMIVTHLTVTRDSYTLKSINEKGEVVLEKNYRW